jgi:hypothetical protein
MLDPRAKMPADGLGRFAGGFDGGFARHKEFDKPDFCLACRIWQSKMSEINPACRNLQ